LKPKKILFITLRTFSLVGGIEKVCRAISYSLQSLSKKQAIDYQLYSLYDAVPDTAYIVSQNFRGFGGQLFKGIFSSIWRGIQCETIILSHINLSLIGVLVKIISPKTRVILWTHGIEIWRPLNYIQKLFLKKTNQIIAVSDFTKEIIIKKHLVDKNKILVIPNCLDPLFKYPVINTNPDVFQTAKMKTPYIAVLCRLSSTEKNKNYDTIIDIIGQLKRERIALNYILCGKYQNDEFDRIKNLAKDSDVEDQIILTGFVNDEEIAKIYSDALAFVMPSIKEGFGLVFIEAQAHGLPVICGDQDGSVETLKHELAGFAINPSQSSAIKNRLIQMIQNPVSLEEKIIIQNKCIENFGYPTFEDKIHHLVLETINE
jgi:phosphatidylinositol alpha-1,6-mannosyltransferase